MFNLDKLNEVYHTLSSNLLRTILTAFGVGWGVLMLMVMLGAGNGLENGVKSEFDGFAANAGFMWTRRTTMPYKGFKRGRGFEMNNADMKALESVEGVDVISPRNKIGGYRGANNVVRGDKTGAFGVNGDYPQINKIQTYRVMTKGRFINDDDVRERRKVAAIGERVYEILYEPGEDPIGTYIKINNINFMVVGVANTTRSGNDAEEDIQDIYIPMSTFQAAFNYGDVIGWFGYVANENYKPEEVQALIMDKLKSRHSIHPKDDNAFGKFTFQERFESMNNTFAGIKLISWVVGILTLIAGVIGISNIMLVIVKERTKELGVRRAIGATPYAVISQIILESVILTTLAGFLGLLLGVGLVEASDNFIKHQVFLNPTIDVRVAAIALSIIIVSGIFAGLLPAYRAVTIKPVDALRTK